MQQPFNPAYRPPRWLRLVMLAAGIGALAVFGAVLGHGLGAGDAQARAATATSTAAPLAIVSTPFATAPAPTSAESTPTALATLAPTAVAATSTPNAPPTADIVARRLPATGAAETAADSGVIMLVLIAAGILLYIGGLALCIAPQSMLSKPEEKE